MLVIGLTGGIASGKSTVAKLFADLNVPIIDTDQLAREVVAPNQAAFKAIRDHFGQDILDTTQHLDRKKLRTRIFNDPAERKWLENLLHPLIRDLTAAKLAQIAAPYCMIVIPLLVESAANPLIQRILVVDVPRATQKQRLLQRDAATAEQVEQILAAQASREQRLAKADDIIDNSDNIEELKKQIKKLHHCYLELAKNYE